MRRPTCTDQFRAPCLEQLAQSNLRRATCTEQLAQSRSNLQGAQFAQSNLQGATCRDQLAGATCAEQLAQSNLHSATCVEQLAQTNLHRPVSAEHLAWCCLALASQMLRGGKKNAFCSVGPTSLAMLCFRANRGLVGFPRYRFKMVLACKTNYGMAPYITKRRGVVFFSPFASLKPTKAGSRWAGVKIGRP